MTNSADEVWDAFRLDIDAASDGMEQCLLELEAVGRHEPAVIQALYRALHTFKGTARMMGMPHIERVAHRAEDLVSIARDRELPLSPACSEVLLVTLDHLRSAGHDAALARADQSEASAAGVLARIEACLLEWAPDRSSAAESSEAAGAGGEAGFVLFDSLPAAETPLAPAAASAAAAESRADVPVALARAARPLARQPASARTDEQAATKSSAKAEEYIRIQARKVQQLVDLAAEIGLAVHTVTQSPALAGVDNEALHEASYALRRLVRELCDSAAALALVPVSTVLLRMKRVVRDVAQETRKEIELHIEGEDTEVDKALVERLADPLLHLLRNAADHGLEPPDERVAAGKSRVGTIVISVAQQGGQVLVSVADDGRGLNRERILSRAIERGLVRAGDVLDDREVWNLIFEPGFSTAEAVSNLSGRGVGMDVVKSTVESLQGRIDITTRPGQGTQVCLRLPLTLAFLDGLVVRSGGRAFVFPLDMVSKIYRSEGSELCSVSARERHVVRVDGELAPVCWLERFYGYSPAARGGPQSCRVVVLVQTKRGKLAIPVDELLGSHQVTMKPLCGAFRRIRAATACGVLGSGDVAIALDCEKLHEHVV